MARRAGVHCSGAGSVGLSAFGQETMVSALVASRRLVTPIICTVDFSRRRRGVQNEFTAVFRKVPEGYIGFVEELPGANTQGETLEEVRANLEEAVRLVLEANRLLAEEELAGAEVIREPLRITAA
jgi:predicted RNase H-like HicB family nuclease